MGFWDIVGKVASTVIEIGARSHADFQRNAGEKIRDYERKLAQAEGSSRMRDPEYAKKVEAARQKFEAGKQKFYGVSSPNTVVKDGVTLIGGLSVDQWDSRWQRLGILGSLTLSDLSRYNQSIGLYKAELGGKTVYIGRAVEYNNGGFRKRLRDYLRSSDSGRTHTSGGKMNQYADRITLSILVVGTSEKEVGLVKELEVAMIMKHGPAWNVQFRA
ncbi:hypothetical protein FE782_01750 [Paenibacillus antri]|uniref:GIY-YIG domain-containing protein n=1 Tax=Paenibacillus antri TaxID=2582848 RepID=A0A5R9GLR5_9BACL|nr:GIY-YIG nuclease family protein [Paenibacillus antri]TLS54093.1 hypothetical protein FE782_01750 [Paenibacillus antri]